MVLMTEEQLAKYQILRQVIPNNGDWDLFEKLMNMTEKEISVARSACEALGWKM